MGLVITFLLGIFILIGALISYIAKDNKIVNQISFSVALGTLASLLILDLLPEAFEHLNDNYLLIIFGALLGFAILKILDNFVPEHDCHHHHLNCNHEFTKDNLNNLGIMSAVAVMIHNIIEGMAVYSITKVSVTNGIMVALGVGLHNIPMGMVIGSSLKENKHKNLILLLTILSTFFGGLSMMLLWNLINDIIIGFLISVTLGMILYIIIFELIPVLLHLKRWNISGIGTLIGILIIIISSLIGE